MLRTAYSEYGDGYTDMLYMPFFGSKVVGKAMYKREGNERDNMFSLWSVRILPDKQGKGYGHQMICEVIQLLQKKFNCRRIYLHVRANNYPALKIYQKAGFKIVRYANSRDTYRMEWNNL